jgi:hypothetical protein
VHKTNKVPRDTHQAEITQPPTTYIPPALTDLGTLRQQTFGGGGSYIENRDANKAG